MDHQSELSNLLSDMDLAGGGMPAGYGSRQQQAAAAAAAQQQQQQHQAHHQGTAQQQAMHDPRYQHAAAGGMPQPHGGGGGGGGVRRGGGGATGGAGAHGMGVGGAPGAQQQQRGMGGADACGPPGGAARGGSASGEFGAGGMGGQHLSDPVSAAQLSQLLQNPSVLAQNPGLMQQLMGSGAAAVAYGTGAQAPGLGAAAGMPGHAAMYGAGRGAPGMGSAAAPLGAYDGVGAGYYANVPAGARADPAMMPSLLAAGLAGVGTPAAGAMPVGPGGLVVDGAAHRRPRPTERAVGIREVHPLTTVEEICQEVGIYGPIEQVSLDTSKGNAIVHFVDAAYAAQLCAERSLLQFHGQLSAVGIEKSRPMPAELAQAVAAGATRNLYINLGSGGASAAERLSAEMLRELFGAHGTIESVRVLAKQAIAFVNFTTVAAAIKAKDALQGTTIRLPPPPLRPPRGHRARGHAAAAAGAPAAASPAAEGDAAAPASAAPKDTPAVADGAAAAAPQGAAAAAPAALAGAAPAAAPAADCAPAAAETGWITRELHISFTSAQQNCRKNMELLAGVIHPAHAHGRGYGGFGGRGGRHHGGGRGGRGGRGGGHGGGRGAPREPREHKPAEELSQSRSVYVGNLPPQTSYADLCAAATPFGPLESVRIVPHTRYAFMNFCSDESAQRFHAKGNDDERGLVLKHQRLVVNWAKAPALPEELRAAIARGATRHVHVGGIDGTVTYQMLEAEFCAYGEIESMRIMQPPHYGSPHAGAFINFTSIASAIMAKEALHGVPFKNKALTIEFAQGPGTRSRDGKERGNQRRKDKGGKAKGGAKATAAAEGDAAAGDANAPAGAGSTADHSRSQAVDAAHGASAAAVDSIASGPAPAEASA